MQRLRNWQILLIGVGGVVAACTETTRLLPTQTGGPSAVQSAASLDTEKLTKLREYSEGGCALSSLDSAGRLRGFAAKRQDVPFALPAIQHDPINNKGDGRAVHVTFKKPGGAAVAANCWLPRRVSPQQVVGAIHSMRSADWKAAVNAISRAQPLPDSAARGPLSPEAKAFKAEMLADTATPTTTRGSTATFNTGCDAVDGDFWYYDDASALWIEIVIEVDVCDDTDADFFGWLIDNGYTEPPYVSVDASAYEITALDSVTFTAHLSASAPRIGWEWVPADGVTNDPWTVACTGNALTCRIQVHGTGTMYYWIAVPQGNIDGWIDIRATMPDSLDDNPGDVDDGDAPITTASGLTPIDTLTGLAILGYAEFEPEWVYTQGCYHCSPQYAGTGPHPDGPNWEDDKNLSNRYGDCTDFVWKMIRKELSSTVWPFGITRTTGYEGLTTNTLAQQHGFILTDSAHAQRGDVVVTNTIGGSGHAGIFAGMAEDWHPIGEANNGYPTTTTRKRHDGTTGRHDFKAKAGQHTLYFRVAHY